MVVLCGLGTPGVQDRMNAIICQAHSTSWTSGPVLCEGFAIAQQVFRHARPNGRNAGKRCWERLLLNRLPISRKSLDGSPRWSGFQSQPRLSCLSLPAQQPLKTACRVPSLTNATHRAMTSANGLRPRPLRLHSQTVRTRQSEAKRSAMTRSSRLRLAAILPAQNSVRVAGSLNSGQSWPCQKQP